MTRTTWFILTLTALAVAFVSQQDILALILLGAVIPIMVEWILEPRRRTQSRMSPYSDVDSNQLEIHYKGKYVLLHLDPADLRQTGEAFYERFLYPALMQLELPTSFHVAQNTHDEFGNPINPPLFSYLQPAPEDKPIVEGWEQHEIIVAESQSDIYNPLRALSLDNKRKTLSRWSFSREERLAIYHGADLWLCLMNFRQPLQPVQLFISNPAPNVTGMEANEWHR
jgi:hypothetical protein